MLPALALRGLHRLIVVRLDEVPALLDGIGKIVVGGLDGKPARLTDARVVQIVDYGTLDPRAYVQTHHDVVDGVDVQAPSAAAAEADAIRAKCAGCGEFLSAVRVEMGIARCSSCDSARRAAEGAPIVKAASPARADRPQARGRRGPPPPRRALSRRF